MARAARKVSKPIAKRPKRPVGNYAGGKWLLWDRSTPPKPKGTKVKRPKAKR